MIWYSAANVRTKFGGSGTISDPWSLAFALSSRSSLNAGDTLFLGGGVYHAEQKLGRLICKLSGGQLGAPITIRSAPGEWATIDGGVRRSNSSAAATDVAGVDSESPALRISCPHTVWQDLSITNSDSRHAKPSIRKNSTQLFRASILAIVARHLVLLCCFRTDRLSNACVEVDASNVLLSNVRVHNCAVGIDVDSGGGAYSGNVTVRGSVIRDIGLHLLLDSSAALPQVAAYANGLNVENNGVAMNVIDGNLFHNIAGSAVNLYACCKNRNINVSSMLVVVG